MSEGCEAVRMMGAVSRAVAFQQAGMDDLLRSFGNYVLLEQGVGRSTFMRTGTDGFQTDAIENPGWHNRADWLPLASLSTAMNLFRGDLNAYQVSREEFLDEILAIAVWMERMARMTGQDPLKAFITGVYGRVGMIIIERFARAVPPPQKPRHFPQVAYQIRTERESIGHDSVELGYQALTQWGFHGEIVGAVRYQSRPMLTKQHRHMAVLLHLANLLSVSVAENEHAFYINDLPPQLLLEGGLLQSEISAQFDRVELRFHTLRDALYGVYAVS